MLLKLALRALRWCVHAINASKISLKGLEVVCALVCANECVRVCVHVYWGGLHTY